MMLPACRVRMVSALVAVAFIGLPLAPPAHVHPAGIESRSTPVTHSHQIPVQIQVPVPGGRSLAPPHGSHAAAVFLTTVARHESGASQAPAPPLVGIVTPPPLRLTGGAHRNSDTPSINGPPGRSWLTRGPPVVLPS